MRLSNESIKYILDLQKKMLPLIYCCCSYERLDTLSKSIINCNGKVRYSSDGNNNSDDEISTLLIFLDKIDIDDILDIEKRLIYSRKKEVVLLEVDGINSLIHKRNLVVSLINRYKINIVKGYKEEIDSLIKFQYNDKNSEEDTSKYRYFAKKNDIVIVIKGKNYYITDGYSEFQIRSINNNFFDNEYLENIYTGMIACSIGVCNSKSEIIQAILISSMAFYIAKERTFKLLESKSFDYKEIKNIELAKEKLLDLIYKLKEEDIKAYGDIDYCFKR